MRIVLVVLVAVAGAVGAGYVAEGALALWGPPGALLALAVGLAIGIAGARLAEALLGD